MPDKILVTNDAQLGYLAKNPPNMRFEKFVKLTGVILLPASI